MSVAAAPPARYSDRLIGVAVALIGSAIAATTAGAIAISHGQTRAQTTSIAIASLAAGCSFVIAGTIALLARSEKHTGSLMALAGFVLLAASTAQSSNSFPFTVGLAVATAPGAILAHLILRFPDDRLHSRAERIAIALAYVDVTVLQVAMLMFMGSEHMRGCPCPKNLLLIRDDTAVHSVLMSSQRALSFALICWTTVLVVLRWRHASPPLRRAVTPLIATGLLWSALVGLTLITDGISTRLSLVFATAEEVALAIIPVAFLLGLLQAHLARGSVSDLMVEIDRLDSPGRLRDALARALHDPSLELAYWLPDTHEYVGIDGRPVDVTQTAPRAVTPLDRGGRRIAALIHDPALAENGVLLDAVSSAAGLTLENERLQAELRAQLDELRESRARIVEAGDAARRRLERNLHDGAQQRLVALSVALALVQKRLSTDATGATQLLSEAKEELAAALEELRELARGLHPAILQRGVEAALKALADRSPIPVELDLRIEREPPPSVGATAYYVVSEALTNVARYADATRTTVCAQTIGGELRLEVADDGKGGAVLRPGSGLEGLRDRIQAIGGAFEFHSREGTGTTLSASLPLRTPPTR